MLRSLIRSRLVLIALPLLSGLLAASVTAASQTSPRDSQQVAQQPKVQKVNESQRSLRALRRGRVAADRLPPQAAEAVDQGFMGENKAFSRKALETNFARTYYVVPGQADVVCLTTNKGAGLCGPLRLAESGELGGTEACAPGNASKYVQFGMVPDEAGKSIEVSFEDGDRRVAKVQDNVYAFTVSKSGPKPVRISWRTLGGGTADAVPYVDTAATEVLCTG